MGDIEQYLKDLERELKTEIAREHAHRPALKKFIESLDIQRRVTATNEPKRQECGIPDFVVDRDGLSIGYIETKDIGKSLDEAERSEQLGRYRANLHSLILTDYLEFRWYVKGKERKRARLGRIGEAGKIVFDREAGCEVVELLEDFLSSEPEEITNPQVLSQRLATLAHRIRGEVVKSFEKGTASGSLKNLRKAFAEVLIPDIDQPEKNAEFADMYAQTIVYGLFAARCNHQGPGSFQRLGAAREIPKTNPFLRQLFETITGTALDDEPYVVFVEDLVRVLANTDVNAVLANFGKKTQQKDPVFHFYEGFLAAYDPKLREQRGVYYTPEPVVSYIVRSVNLILKMKTCFGLGGGLADSSTVEYFLEAPVPDFHGEPDKGKLPERKRKESPKVLILDPACGTGTFLYSVVNHIRREFMECGDAGMWSDYVRHHLLPRIFGFELLMAPYAVAHFKLGMQLAGQDLSENQQKDWAYDFSSNERLGIYLT
ncbi:MAG: type ISP restriction/modification enzyme, partial [Methanotrichaceae archaeon]